MNILLIANKGKLHLAVERKIQKNNNIILYLINKKLNLNQLKEGFRSKVSNNKLDLIIFISGETRDESKMMLLNYLLPKEILQISQSKSIPLFYLSSLSVFGIPTKKIITENSERNSIDLYSTTKNLFDAFAKKNCLNALIISILPGAIINFKSQNDITNKLINFSKTFPQCLFLKFIHPQGNISCIDVEDLAKVISLEANILSKEKHAITFTSKICTVNISISKIIENIFTQKKLLLFPNLTFLKRKNFEFILGKIDLKKFVLFFNNIKYKSSYHFNEKDYLNNFHY